MGEWRARAGGHADARSGSGAWLLCLRRLYAAVPPEWLSTVELVLEQTLHQMPEVAESLLDAIQDTGCADSDVDGSIGGREMIAGAEIPPKTVWPSTAGFAGATTSIGNDLGLLLLLLREASPLRACSLPLLPDGVDRGRRAEDGIRHLLLVAARRGWNRWSRAISGMRSRRGCTGGVSEREGRKGALDGARALLLDVLCSVSSSLGRGSGHFCAVGGGNSAIGAGSACRGGGGKSSGVASERASQLLELALRWLEEGDGEKGAGSGGAACGDRGYRTDLTTQDLASETISAVFHAVGGARPKLLRALLSGVFDQSKGGAVCARSYLQAWEALMVQEARQQVSARDGVRVGRRMER